MKGKEVLRRVLLIANYGIFGFLGLVFIICYLLFTNIPESEGFLDPYLGFALLAFGVAYGLQKLINWIFLPEEAMTTKDTASIRPPPLPTIFEKEESVQSEEAETQAPRVASYFNWVVPAAGVISVLVSVINGTLALLLFLLWAMNSPVTGGTGYIPFEESGVICIVALVGGIFGLISICSKNGARSQIRLAVVVILGCLPNSFVFCVSFLIRYG